MRLRDEDTVALVKVVLPLFMSDLLFQGCITSPHCALGGEDLENFQDSFRNEVGLLYLTINDDYDISPGLSAECLRIIQAVLNVMESLLSEQWVESGQDILEHRMFPKLRTLQRRSNGTQNPENDLNDLNHWGTAGLRSTLNVQEQNTILKIMRKCNAKLDEIFKKAITEAASRDRSRKYRREPPYKSQELAHTIYHVLATKLSGCTVTDVSTSHIAQLHISNTKTHRSLYEYMECDMLFSTHAQPRRWQEIKLCIKSQGKMNSPKARTFCNDGSPVDCRGEDPVFSKRKEILNICDIVQQIQGKMSRLNVLVDQGKMWRVQASQFAATQTKAACVNGHPVSFNELFNNIVAMDQMDKRILSLMLAYTVLHLYRSPWLSENWGKDDVFFYSRKTGDFSFDMSKPYISTEFHASPVRPEDDLDEWDRPHPHPCILALGILLLEIELGVAIDLSRDPADLIEGQTKAHTDFYTAWRLFKSPKLYKNVYEGYRSAVEACLKCDFLPQDTSLDESSFQESIYKNIILPIEDELFEGWPGISLDAIDGIKDFSDPSISISLTGAIQETSTKEDTSAILTTLTSQQTLTALKITAADDRLPAHMPKESSDKTSRMQIFDDHSPRNTDEACMLSNTWFKRFDQFFNSKVRPLFDEGDDLPQRKPAGIKVAVLDTGIDGDNVIIKANKERIKETRSWVQDDSKMEDTYGHSAHVVALVLKMAPTAELCVARVAEGGYLDNEDYVVEAINWAVQNCKANIVTMSFGLSKRNNKVWTTILSHTNTVFFAATNNDGGNCEIAYPAKHQVVIGINSTDGQGNSSAFNPSPLDGQLNFSTLGEAIESQFRDASGKRCQVLNSGTSYATAIAAGMSATILEYVMAKLDLNELDAKFLYRRDGIQAMLKVMSEKRGGYDYIAPWILWKKDESEASIHRKIYEALMD